MNEKPVRNFVTQTDALMRAVGAAKSEGDWINAIAEIHLNLDVQPLISLLCLGGPAPPSALRALADLLDAGSEHSSTSAVLVPERRKGQTKEKDEAFQRKLAAVLDCERLQRQGVSINEAIKLSAEKFGWDDERYFRRFRKEVLAWMKWLAGSR
jgi:hypothetical protein